MNKNEEITFIASIIADEFQDILDDIANGGAFNFKYTERWAKKLLKTFDRKINYVPQNPKSARR